MAVNYICCQNIVFLIYKKMEKYKNLEIYFKGISKVLSVKNLVKEIPNDCPFFYELKQKVSELLIL